MFTSIKNFFFSIYETMKRKIIGVYIRCKNWLVDTLTGEIIYDINNIDVNPTFWDAVCRASSNVVLGKRAAHAETDTTKKRVTGAVIRNATIGIGATGVAAIATLFGATFISGFWTTVITFYGVAFVANLVLELFKNYMLKKIDAVMKDALSAFADGDESVSE
ncbi:MAG: hypothetical protein QJT81_16395 [Candidatus Thiothrix putei]|uniref:Uncharacterized protein n=1 Tax=Candidatus Thiothrix putei TaxID=3080811 RepID=A0AA95KHH9_9GAMM|nr:MAG: hypothetical protein QJT81_16395 [Candidatus Thiothrix putei]